MVEQCVLTFSNQGKVEAVLLVEQSVLWGELNIRFKQTFVDADMGVKNG